MPEASSLQGLMDRLRAGSKVYSGGSVGPTSGTALSPIAAARIKQEQVRAQAARAGMSGSTGPMKAMQFTSGPAMYADPNDFSKRITAQQAAQHGGGGYTPTTGLAFDPDLARGERDINTQLQELIAFTNRDRSRTTQDYGRASMDLQSDLGGRGLFGSSPGNEQEARLDTSRQRALGDIETRYTQGSGRFTDALAEIARQRSLITKQKELERAQQVARTQALQDQFVNKVPLEGLNKKWLEVSDPGTVLKILQRQMGRNI